MRLNLRVPSTRRPIGRADAPPAAAAAAFAAGLAVGSRRELRIGSPTSSPHPLPSQRVYPRQAVEAYLAAGVRSDGRPPGEARPASSTPGGLPGVAGSCLARLGDTACLAAVRLLPCPPCLLDPDGGDDDAPALRPPPAPGTAAAARSAAASAALESAAAFEPAVPAPPAPAAGSAVSTQSAFTIRSRPPGARLTRTSTPWASAPPGKAPEAATARAAALARPARSPRPRPAATHGGGATARTPRARWGARWRGEASWVARTQSRDQVVGQTAEAERGDDGQGDAPSTTASRARAPSAAATWTCASGSSIQGALTTIRAGNRSVGGSTDTAARDEGPEGPAAPAAAASSASRSRLRPVSR